MESQIKYEILDSTRQAMCSQLAALKQDFYLAGGTGLALQIGHRISEDFDFFTNDRFDPPRLLRRMTELFQKYEIEQLQNEDRTLTLLIQGVKISFYFVEPAPLTPLQDSKYFRIASIQEIGTFKLDALLRAALKDYVDLFFILQKHTLHDLFTLARKKYPGIDEAVYLKAMLSYDDIDLSPIRYIAGYETSPETIFHSLREHVDRYLKEDARKK